MPLLPISYAVIKMSYFELPVMNYVLLLRHGLPINYMPAEVSQNNCCVQMLLYWCVTTIFYFGKKIVSQYIIGKLEINVFVYFL